MITPSAGNSSQISSYKNDSTYGIKSSGLHCNWKTQKWEWLQQCILLRRGVDEASKTPAWSPTASVSLPNRLDLVLPIGLKMVTDKSEGDNVQLFFTFRDQPA